MRLQHELSLLNTYQSSQLSGVSAQQLEESSASLALTVTWADLVPPLRVTDLEVIHVHNTTVNLTWWWQRTQKIRLCSEVAMKDWFKTHITGWHP
ncbi:hypothetical protein Pcinc_029353 [Petrolisthes cinctipes]|uniref:Uncharacterized protein n=1 Tax=Petrolisthes cinctipes TaxID=88211 RepID=A0AAE1K5U1_PETCI|nr:hypothetical protein Pcinc_029353 [Petrolisthes cinctipes]